MHRVIVLPCGMARGVLLLVNRSKPDVVAALDEVRRLITAHGRLVSELDADNTPLPSHKAAGAELIVVLGGDGTLLGQSRRCVALGLPMLGVNFGKLGFMAEFDMSSLRDHAASLFGRGPLVVQDRPMLRVSVTPHNGRTIDVTSPTGVPSHGPGQGQHGCGESEDVTLYRTLALNDAVVTAGPPYRMITLDLRIDGHQGPQVTGDGIVVSTPIGSTAYNAALGGPIISPGVSAMVVTPMAAQSLSFRPVVVPASSTIEIVLNRVNDQPGVAGLGGGTSLVLDGQVATRLNQGQTIVIRQHARAVQFIRNPNSNYWSTLIHKMKWATPTAGRS